MHFLRPHPRDGAVSPHNVIKSIVKSLFYWLLCTVRIAAQIHKYVRPSDHILLAGHVCSKHNTPIKNTSNNLWHIHLKTTIETTAARETTEEIVTVGCVQPLEYACTIFICIPSHLTIYSRRSVQRYRTRVSRARGRSLTLEPH